MDGGTKRQTPDDLIQPFQLESNAARGRLVRLGPLVESALDRHDYPEPIATVLGELLALAALVSAALKFDGVFTVQAKGEGPVRTLVADITTAGDMRGFAQYDEEALAALLDQGESWRRAPVPRLLGAGHLAFTVDQGTDTARFQGIVELRGATLAECAHEYLGQSEQLQAVVRLAAGHRGSGGWRAGGLMIQRLPGEGRAPLSGEAQDEDVEEAWRRALVLMGSSTDDELLDAGLHPHRLLYRLFHEEGVRVFEPQPLAMHCRCSQHKVEVMLRSFPRAEIEDLKVDDMVVVTCEFCGVDYRFGDSGLDGVYAP